MSANDPYENSLPVQLPTIPQQIEEKEDDKIPGKLDSPGILQHPSIKMGITDDQFQAKVPINRELQAQDSTNSENTVNTTVNNTTTINENIDNNDEAMDYQVNQWESIFSPQTTFKQNNRGGLEYTGLDVSRLSLHIATSPQRVRNNNSQHKLHKSGSTATIPNIMPSPPLESSTDNSRQLDQVSHNGSRLDILRDVLNSPEEKPLDNVNLEKKNQNSLSHTKHRLLRSILPQRNQDIEKQQKSSAYWSQQRLFWTGFAFPPIWIYCSFQKNVPEPLWRKRCRFASFYFLIIIGVVILLVAVRNTDGTRHIHSDGITAVINE